MIKIERVIKLLLNVFGCKYAVFYYILCYFHVIFPRTLGNPFVTESINI